MLYFRKIMIERKQIEEAFLSLQKEICFGMEALDGKETFSNEPWQRKEGGGGITRVIQNGHVFEKGGVNFSAVEGTLPDNIRAALKVEGDSFYATGVSIVIHPQNPWVPIIHMNIRYFETEQTFWFGGGIDLTPHYIIDEDATYFHQQLKQTCNLFDPSYYPKFKTWADDYFFIKHREETRGIGGIFFDRLSGNSEKEALFNFVLAVGKTFLPTYSYLVTKNKEKKYTEENKTWQNLRRGRYVEFNLVYDKGTKFGLDTNGRIESILMSLPTTAQWLYDFQPQKNSPEAITLSKLKKGINW